MASKKRKMPDDSSECGPEMDLGAQEHLDQHRRPRRRHPPTAAGADSYFRHLYDTEPDFKQLAKEDADFAAVLQDNGQLNFTDPASVMQLTKTLLKTDFGLEIELPDDRLCPPVPNRHNYILWLKSLLDSTTYSPHPETQTITGLDIGTGASCIYPLLGTIQRSGWHFLATDIDAQSLSYAQRNIDLNRLSSRITLLPRSPEDSLIPSLELLSPQCPLDFVMMNPPFYASQSEMLASAAKKSRPPSSACTGASVEMVCEGGEVAHVGRLLRESLVLRERGARWYTSMLGKVTSLEVLVGRLREEKVDNFAVKEFIQGNKTKRWAVGWSFGAMRAEEGVARGLGSAVWKRLMPPGVRIELGSLGVEGAGKVVERIKEVVGGLELLGWAWEGDKGRGIGRAGGNVWGRAWRRKRARGEAEGIGGGAEKKGEEEVECKLGFEIRVEVGMEETKVSLLWREGHDPSLFESLGGFLQGKLKDLVPGQ